MRLIDADTFKKQIAGMTIANNYPVNKASALCDLIDAQPTAYDLDKAVELMKKRTAYLQDCTKYGNETEKQRDRSYSTMMLYEVADLVEDLLEIVKGGGVDAF